MFEARLDDGNVFKKVVDAIKDLVTDANIDCTEEEMSIQCMDSSHVSLVNMVLSANTFNHYRCDRSIQLGFNSANLSKVMKLMGPDDSLLLKAEEQDDKLTMMFENPKTNSISDFELKLMDIDADQLTIPDTSYKCTVKMPSREFRRIITDLQVLGDTCSIGVSKEGIKFTVTGEIGTGSVLLRQDMAADKEEDRVEIDMDEPVDLQFALRYLNFFTKASPLGNQVVLSLSPDLPMVVDYPINDTGKIQFFLAPKIEDDDENQD